MKRAKDIKKVTVMGWGAYRIGFNLHDTMIWNKGGFSAVGALKTRYAPVFEYVFIFSKGAVKTFNPIKDRPNKHAGKTGQSTQRQIDGGFKKIQNLLSPTMGRGLISGKSARSVKKVKTRTPHLFRLRSPATIF